MPFQKAVADVWISPLHGWAQSVPPLLNYQGRIIVGSTNFSGTGAFKFALVNAAGGAETGTGVAMR